MVKAETDGQFDSGGRKRLGDGPDRHTRPVARLKGGCVSTVENLGRKKGVKSTVKGDSEAAVTAVKEASLHRQQRLPL